MLNVKNRKIIYYSLAIRMMNWQCPKNCEKRIRKMTKQL